MQPGSWRVEANTPSPDVTRRWLSAILLTAAALRLFPIWFGLPYLRARPDETTAVSLAMGVVQGDWNPHFFHWPSLTIYLFAALFRVASFVRGVLSGDSMPTAAEQILIGRVCVALAGTLTVLVVFHIGRRCVDAATGLVAATLLAVGLLHVRDSHFAMTDVLMTLLAAASLAVLLRAMDEALTAATVASVSATSFVAAGLLAGLATSTKYNAAAVAAAMAAVQVLLVVHFKAKPWSIRAWRPAGAYAAAMIAGFVIATPYAVLDAGTFVADLRHDFAHLSGGHGVNLGPGWIYHLTHTLPYGAGFATLAAAIPGAVWMALERPRHALVLGAFAAAVYASIGSGYTVFFRYALPLIPIVCLFAAAGVRAGASWMATRTSVAECTALAALAALAALPSFVNSLHFDVVLARTDTRVLAAAWLTPRMQAGDTQHDAGGEYATLELARADYHVWFYDPASHSFGHPEGETPVWLVIHDSPLWTHTQESERLRQLAGERYELVFEVYGARGSSRSLVYDLQDAFFMPVSGFARVARPGPTVRIYRRR